MARRGGRRRRTILSGCGERRASKQSHDHQGAPPAHGSEGTAGLGRDYGGPAVRPELRAISGHFGNRGGKPGRSVEMIEAKRLGHATFKAPDMQRAVDYWTHVIGLSVVERSKSQTVLATRFGEEAIALENGDSGELLRTAFQVAPGSDLGDLQKALAKSGVNSEIRSDISPGVAKAVAFTDPKGTLVEL